MSSKDVDSKTRVLPGPNGSTVVVKTKVVPSENGKNFSVTSNFVVNR